MSLTIYIAADNTIEADRLRFATDGSYANAATVTFDLKDVDGNVVGGATGVVMGYVAASNGKYQGTLDATITALLTPGTTYYLDITAVQGLVDGFWKVATTAYYKGAT